MFLRFDDKVLKIDLCHDTYIEFLLRLNEDKLHVHACIKATSISKFAKQFQDHSQYDSVKLIGNKSKGTHSQ